MAINDLGPHLTRNLTTAPGRSRLDVLRTECPAKRSGRGPAVTTHSWAPGYGGDALKICVVVQYYEPGRSPRQPR